MAEPSMGARQRYALLERFRTAEQGARVGADCGCDFLVTGRGPQQIIWCPDHPPHAASGPTEADPLPSEPTSEPLVSESHGSDRSTDEPTPAVVPKSGGS